MLTTAGDWAVSLASGNLLDLAFGSYQGEETPALAADTVAAADNPAPEAAQTTTAPVGAAMDGEGSSSGLLIAAVVAAVLLLIAVIIIIFSRRSA